jgi:hypothetical protein
MFPVTTNRAFFIKRVEEKAAVILMSQNLNP